MYTSAFFFFLCAKIIDTSFRTLYSVEYLFLFFHQTIFKKKISQSNSLRNCSYRSIFNKFTHENSVATFALNAIILQLVTSYNCKIKIRVRHHKSYLFVLRSENMKFWYQSFDAFLLEILERRIFSLERTIFELTCFRISKWISNSF